MPDDLLQIRSLGVNFHVLRDGNGLYLIDAGFLGAGKQLWHQLRRMGWDREKIIGIILTHGHLDHTLHVGSLARQSGAWIAAPRLDAAQYQGQESYRGWARVTGVLEAIGRPVLGFSKFDPELLLDDGDTLDVWHGLRAVSFPGHTAGHMGFYCEKLKLLFSADLFASYKHLAHPPPRIFNSNPAGIWPSIGKALELDLLGVLPNHGDAASPETHLERMGRMYEKWRTNY